MYGERNQAVQGYETVSVQAAHKQIWTLQPITAMTDIDKIMSLVSKTSK